MMIAPSLSHLASIAKEQLAGFPFLDRFRECLAFSIAVRLRECLLGLDRDRLEADPPAWIRSKAEHRDGTT